MSLHIGSSNISDIYVGNSKISDIYVGNDLVYTSNKGPDLAVPLYFEAADPSVAVTVRFRKGSTENTADPSGIDFSKYTGYSDPAWSYSYDGLTWSNYTIGNNITIGGSNPSRVYFKSRTNYTAIPWRGQYTDSSSKLSLTYYTFLQFTAAGGNVKGGGNIQSLLYSDFTAYDSVFAYCFYYMFNSCTPLTEAPVLPATILADSCYRNMFSGCTSLTEAPELPATTLAVSCYASMFYECTSLTSVPSLPATTLESNCYNSMFAGCTSLTSIPKLPATTMVSGCYVSMFNSIKANTTASAPCVYPYRVPESGTGDGETGGLAGMFTNIDGIGNFAPTLNTTFYISVPVAN